MTSPARTMPTKNPHPPAEPRGRGRPRSTDPRTMRGFRATAEEWATYQALGGNAWLMQKLKAARLTPEQASERARILAELAGQQRIEDGGAP